MAPKSLDYETARCFAIAILGVSLKLLIDLVSQLLAKCELLHGYHSTPSLSPEHHSGYFSALASY